MCSDKQLRHAGSPPYIPYTHTQLCSGRAIGTNTAALDDGGRDPCGVIMSPVKTDHQRTHKKSRRRKKEGNTSHRNDICSLNKIWKKKEKLKKKKMFATTRKQKELKHKYTDGALRVLL